MPSFLDMSEKSRRWVVSAVLTCLTLLAISLLRMLPYNKATVLVTDAMTLPGGIIAAAFAAVFGETENWLVTWAWLSIIGNALFYLVLWYALISAYRRFSKTQ